ncbi:MAG: HPr(Ser) kinase/phosphatase [Oscillospiraceae bacterium]|nr:HPr(Ser) kinase/phosphatase [Oscillospiraceae bacterium]
MDSHREKINLTTLINDFHLEEIYVPDNIDEIKIGCTDVHRPGIQLGAGYYDYFDHDRIQILGKAEQFYMMQKTPEERFEGYDRLMSTGVPVVIVTRSLECYPELVETARIHRVPLLRTDESTSDFVAALIGALNVYLAPTITRHGVLVEVYGEGVLLLGDSGVGKSETAIELIKRGHRLVADDAVEIRRTSAKTVVGSSPEIIRHFMELRGIGIVDVKRIFGVGAVKDTEKINLVVNLEVWQQGKNYERLGLDREQTTLLGIELPCLTIPVRPGRNLAVIIEIAAMNNRQQRMGYNAAEELSERLNKQMSEQNITGGDLF